MFFARYLERRIAEVQTFVAFNETLPNGKKLLGIKFDVEPYGSKEWKAGGDQRRQVMRDYLSYLNQVNAYLSTAAPSMELAVDVPFWWDKTEFQILFDGQEKLFVEHVQDRVEAIQTEGLGIYLLCGPRRTLRHRAGFVGPHGTRETLLPGQDARQLSG